MNITPRLKALRIRHNLTQAEAAALLGITQPALSQAERTPSHADRLEAVLAERDPLLTVPIQLHSPKARFATRDAIRRLYPDAYLVPTAKPGEAHDAYLARVRVALEVRA
jgi:transcriptional regulator with XRE-family HTH domain